MPTSDFNSPCLTHAGHCGPAVLQQQDHPARDVTDLRDLLVTHDLCACNTLRTDVARATFRSGDYQSQLDFVFLCRSHASAISRRSRALHSVPVGRWRSGAFHYPVLTEVPCHWKPRYKSDIRAKARPSIDIGALAKASMMQGDPRIAELQEFAVSHVQSDPDLLTLDTALTRKVRSNQGSGPWQDALISHGSKQMRHVYRTMRGQQRTIRGLVEAWRCWVQGQRWQVRCKQRSREVRRERRLQLLQEAQQAADTHDAWTLYRIVRKLAPKQRGHRFQLRRGCLRTPGRKSRP